MQTETVSKQIQELEAIKTQKRLWQWGTTILLAILVIYCIFTLRSAVYGLAQPGPTQEAFQKDLGERVQKNAIPALEDYAVTAARGIDYAGTAQKLNTRTPELVKTTLDQMRLLSDDLSKRGEKVLDKTFTTALKAEDKKIRAMFPEANEEQVNGLMANLTKEAQDQIVDVNETLFGAHKKALDNIVTDLTLIQTSEAANIKGEVPSWEMGLLIFDITREDLKSLETKDSSAGPAKNAGKSKSDKEKK